MQTGPAKERHLLVTMTNEPFQPVRLYYAVPDQSLVIRKLTALHCMVEAPIERCNTHLTLTAIIVRMVEQSMRDRGGHQGP